MKQISYITACNTAIVIISYPYLSEAFINLNRPLKVSLIPGRKTTSSDPPLVKLSPPPLYTLLPPSTEASDADSPETKSNLDPSLYPLLFLTLIIGETEQATPIANLKTDNPFRDRAPQQPSVPSIAYACPS